MIYRAIVAALAACVAAAASAAHPSFEEFVKSYSKSYAPGSEQWLQHKKLYYQELDRIDQHNRAFASGMISFKLGVNKFSDLGDDEMQSFMGYSGVRSSLKHGKNLKGIHTPGTVKEPAPSLDWTKKGAVGPVRDQGSCGSCWAHAAGAEVESHLAISEGILTDLSVQQLVDCAPNDNNCGGTGGCHGSTAPLAFDYLIDAGGMSIEWAYPYVDYWFSREEQVHKCYYNNDEAVADGSVGAVLDGYVVVEDNSYDAMLEAVNVGPVAINVAASAWKSYAGGVFDGCSYDDIIINHVVQLVGYGTDEETDLDYWLVKNSWGPYWGEEGFIRLRRHNPYKGEEVPCGPDTRPQDGTECEDGPKVINVCGPCGMYWQGAYPTGVRRPSNV